MNSPLFERQATGGVVARVGFEYQDGYLLEQLPLLLSQSGFSHVVSENLGDIEARYHRPGGGTSCVAYEAKRNQLTATDLWGEVDRFVQMHTASPDEYVRFVLVCGDYAGAFLPLLNKLQRLRGTAASMNADSAVLLAAQNEVEAQIVNLGQTASTARFVRERVHFVKYSDGNVGGAFAAALTEHLPAAQEMRVGEVAAFRERCQALVTHSVRGVVHRGDLEAALLQSAPGLAAAWAGTPSRVQLLADASADLEELGLRLGEFNGDSRGQLGATAWAALQTQLQGIGAFVHATRERKGISLSGKQRMSLACTVGYSFSATRDFTLQIDHNGSIFDTAKHDRGAAPFFNPADEQAGSRLEGIASISFPYPGRADVTAAAATLGLEGAAMLHLESGEVVADIAQLNTAVHEAKAALAAFRAAHKLQRLHLFVKAPSVFAMALGHRLNGVGTIQLYDWVDGAYQPTALLT